MKLKKGDKLFCKKTARPNFYKGEWYEVEQFILTSIVILRRLSVEDPNGFGSHAQIIVNDLDEYFYTEKEIRKLKLDEIEGRK